MLIDEEFAGRPNLTIENDPFAARIDSEGRSAKG